MRMLGFKEIQDNDTGHSDLRSSGDVSKFDDQQVNTRELAPDLALSVNNFLEASGSVFRLRTFNDEKEDGDSQSLNDDNSGTDKDSTKTSE
jgi:hypothetical protein